MEKPDPINFLQKIVKNNLDSLLNVFCPLICDNLENTFEINWLFFTFFTINCHNLESNQGLHGHNVIFYPLNYYGSSNILILKNCYYFLFKDLTAFPKFIQHIKKTRLEISFSKCFFHKNFRFIVIIYLFYRT